MPWRRSADSESLRRARGPPGILPERVLGALGAAWTETVRDLGGGDKDAAFVWGGGEKFARLLMDTCVHRLVFRDEPGAAGNRLAADALMTLQDLATARVPLGRDAETVALAACAAFMNHVTKSDDALEAAARLTANAPGPSEDARAIAKRGLIRLGGRTGYESALKGAGIGEGGRAGSSGGRDRIDRGSGSESGGGFYDGRRGGYDDRRDDRYDDDRYERRSPRQQARKSGDWDCAECGFMNFASRRECKQCGSPGGGGSVRGPVSSGCGDADAFDLERGGSRSFGSRDRADRFAPKPGDWECPGCGFSSFASRTECKVCGAPGGTGTGGYGGGGGGGGGGWEDDRGGGGGGRVRGWTSEGGDRGFDRGFDRSSRYGRGAEGGGGGGGGMGGTGGGGGGGGGGRGRGRGEGGTTAATAGRGGGTRGGATRGGGTTGATRGSGVN